jgi:CRISPR/Cas system-associated exonuclease Cas4 (RecB family)
MNIPLNTTAYLIESYQPKDEPKKFNYSFYASNFGEECPKKQWLTFLSAFTDNVSNQVKRLFNRGNQEEAHIIKLLREVGIQVVSPYDTDKEHFKFTHLNGHIRGKLDAVAVKGVPEAPHKVHVLEFKTMNDKNFQIMKRDGLEKANVKYFAQVQAYMLKKNIDRALFIAVNKNTDEIYIERVKLSKQYAQKLFDDATTIILNKNSIPPGISEDKTFFKCKFCPANKVCHGDELPEVNCRTCVFSRTSEDGNWYCDFWKQKTGATNPIPMEFQKTGCSNHLYIPSLLKSLNKNCANTETNLGEVVADPAEYYFIWNFDGHFIKTGGSEPCFSSKELKSLNSLLLDPTLGKIKENFKDASVC